MDSVQGPVPTAFRTQAVRNLQKVTSVQPRDLNKIHQGAIGAAVTRDYRYINKSNGKYQPRNWSRNGQRPDFSLDDIRKSDVRIQSEFEKTLGVFSYKKQSDVNRYD